MLSPCLSGGRLKRETIDYLLPSFQALRTQLPISIHKIFGTILSGCLSLRCSNDLPKFTLSLKLICLLADWTAKFTPLYPGNWNRGPCAIDAFSISWTDLKFYAFLPFSILGRVLAKVQQDGATGMLVTLLWSTQPWFPQLLEMVIEHPRMLTPGKDLLQLQGKLDVLHPLHSKLSLLVTIISGQHSKVLAY